jgi:hypothetical protein
MSSPFKVTCDELAVTLHFTEGRFGLAADMTPDQAIALGHALITKGQDCKDAQEYELEQMR